MNNDGGIVNPGDVVASAQQQVSQPPAGQFMDQSASSVVENVTVPGQQAAQATSEPEQTPADVLVSEVSAALTKYQAAKSK